MLLIITDGIITDMERTKEAIVKVCLILFLRCQVLLFFHDSFEVGCKDL